MHVEIITNTNDPFAGIV